MRLPRVLPMIALLGVLLAGVVLPALAQGGEDSILYEEDFNSGEAAAWELGPGWDVITDETGEMVLAGEGHEWAHPPAAQGYTQDFRLAFRLRVVRGDIHLVYRVNNEGRYFIGFSEGRTALFKQYWPETFTGELTAAAGAYGSTWHDIAIVGQGATLEFWVDGVMAWTYTDPDPLLFGSFAFETLDNALAYIDDIVVYGAAVEPGAVLAETSGWVRTGGPLGGLGYDIRMRPDDPDIMYVTDAWAGVFMSTDGGTNWVPANDGITTRTGESGDAIPVFCLTIDPHDPNIIWAGTQNVRGIFKSTDGGQSWVEMDNGVEEYHGITFRGFTVDPRSSDIVYAAAEIASFAWAGQERSGREFDMTQGVVYRTTNGGESWTAIWRGENLARYVWIDPRDPDVIYISTGIFDREAANSDPAAGTPGGVGIVKSTDGGQTWTAITAGLGNLYVGSLAMHPDNPDILLAGTGNNQYHRDAGVYLSTDGGQTWQYVLRDDIIESVEFAPSDPAIAYAGSAGAVYRSTDTGQTWALVSGGGAHGWGPPGVRAGFPIDFQVDPRDPDRIFANNYGGGNFLSEDGGRTWIVASAGYTGAQVRDVAVSPTEPGHIYAAARSGIFHSTDGGGAWIGLNRAPAAVMEWYVVALDPTDPAHVLASNNWNNHLLQSFDGGERWQAVGPHLGEQGMSFRAIAFAPSDPRMVYAGASAYYSAGTFSEEMPAAGIYVSHDGGTSWNPANDALSQDANVTALAVSPDDPQVVYAATGNHDLIMTVDGGQTWQALNLGLSGSPQALSVAVHPENPAMVFVGLRHAGMFRSADGGQTWQFAGYGMNPESSVSEILFDPLDPMVMYAADRLTGVYRSVDGGETWSQINDGLRLRDVNSLAITTDGQHLYAGTEGEGVYRLDLGGAPPVGSETALR